MNEDYNSLDRDFLPLDRKNIFRTRNIQRIPFESERRGGKYSYAEWAHVIGIFQTLMYLNLNRKEGNRVLDIGCGTGLLGIASEPFLGKYTGIDVGEFEIDFCRKHYPNDKFDFQHLDVSNSSYAPDQKADRLPWSVESENFDMVVALSVWTHFNEMDAMFYLAEVARVLKKGARALITMFILDDDYEKSLSIRTEGELGRYHSTKQDLWVFDQSAYGSKDWFCPSWIKTPEEAIGITPQGLDRMLAESGLGLKELHPGNWKEIPGVFFQDVLVVEKLT